MTLEEMIDEARPVSISAEGWRENFPTAADFEAARVAMERRQAATQRESAPWADKGCTDRDGRFHSFRESQS
jgi:hypothetical protein